MKVKCYLRWWILLCNAFILLSTVSANPLGMEAKPIKDSSQNRAISKAKDTTKYAIFKKLNTGSTYFFYDQTLQTSVPYFTPIDTGLWMVQRFNPVYNGPDFRADRGGLGMPDQLMEYTLKEEVGFSYGVDPFASWRYTLANTPFYQTKRAYTFLSYENNFGKEDLFSVVHSQNVAQGLNLTVDYKVLQMPDNKARYFQNSKTMHHHLRIYGNYFSKKGKYKALFGYIRNSITIGENGGMVTDSLYTQNIEPNRLLIPVNLLKANRSWKENSYFLKHSYHFAKNKGDSLHPNIYSYGFLMHTFELNQYRSVYTDQSSPQEDFYEHFYLNAALTQDTNRIVKMSNTLLYSSSDFESVNKRFPVQFLLGVKNEYIQLKDMIEKNNIVQWIPFAEMRFRSKNFLLDVYYEQVLGGYNAGDLNGALQFAYLFNTGSNTSYRGRDGIRLKAGIKNMQTDWVKQRYLSNHFYFNYDFTPEKEVYAELQLKVLGWEFLAGCYFKDDYVMLLADGPKQVDRSFFVAKA
ncbi:MAG: putative porin, partial [Bacteroidales bacterium]